MFLPALKNWILSVLVALTSAGSAATVVDANSNVPAIVSPSSSATAELSVSEAFSVARYELERTDRVLDALEEAEASPAIFDYFTVLREIHQKYSKIEALSPEQGVMFATSLATDLAFALGALESSVVDFKSWRRVTRAAYPDSRVLRIPRRFVRRATVSGDVGTDAWRDADHAVWS